jgi:hypothetical protein
MKEHYIDVPESKIDVVKQLTAQNSKLKSKLNEEHGKTLKLRRLAEAANKQRIVAQFGRGLTETQVAKLSKLTEDVPYTNAARIPPEANDAQGILLRRRQDKRDRKAFAVDGI